MIEAAEVDPHDAEERLAIRMEAAPSGEELCESAIWCVRRGFHVLEVWGITRDGVCGCKLGAGCRTPGKHPVASAWQKTATCDEREVMRRWPRERAPNVGILTGVDGIAVADLDPRGGALATLARMEAEHGPIPSTFTVATGGRPGRHHYFRVDGRRVTSSKLRGLPGFDCKADGGMVLGPGSFHVSGARYEVALDVEIAPASGWLLDAMLDGGATVAPYDFPILGIDRAIDGRWGTRSDLERRVERALAYIDRMPQAIAGAGGHDATWRVAVALVRGFELPGAAALEVLKHYNARCSPPWSEKELHHKVEQAKRARVPLAYVERMSR